MHTEEVIAGQLDVYISPFLADENQSPLFGYSQNNSLYGDGLITLDMLYLYLARYSQDGFNQPFDVILFAKKETIDLLNKLIGLELNGVMGELEFYFDDHSDELLVVEAAWYISREVLRPILLNGGPLEFKLVFNEE